MSEPTVIDIEHKETEVTEFTLEQRVEALEGQIKSLFIQHKNILQYFRDMVLAVQSVADAAATESGIAAATEEKEVFENVIDLSLLKSPSEE